MKNIIIVLLVLFGATALIQSQSSIIYDAETALDIQSGADVCTDSLIMNGAFTGNGTVCGLVIGIIPVSVEIPKSYELFSNYPNPFNPVTKIRFSIPRSTYTKLTIFNVTGKAVAVLVNENVSPGKYEVDWDASQSASGVYYYMLEADGFKATKKMVLIK